MHPHGRILWQVAAMVVFTMLSPSHAFASIEDKVLKFSSSGPDRYADGSIVVDGECYALVWSPKGKNFSGFNADGTPISSVDRVVLAAPLAQDGRWRDTIFQTPAEEYTELEGGEWAVCLVDTRNLAGEPTGTQNGKPLRVNRWGIISGGVEITSAASARPRLLTSGMQSSSAADTTGRTRSGASGARANILSAVPPNLAPPRITDIEVGDGEVWLAVEGTAPYLSYTIISGEKPNDLKTDYFSETVDGDAKAEILIGTPESPKRRFFKVKRAE